MWFICAGNGYQTPQAITLCRHRGDQLAMHAQGGVLSKRLNDLKASSSLDCGDTYISVIGLFTAKSQSLRHRQKTVSACACHSFSDHSSDNSSIVLRKLGKILLNSGQRHQFKFSKVNRTRAGYRPDEYDITGSELDSFSSSEGTGKAFLSSGLASNASPWWEKFPKRWLIVVLCFAAFLLCNMDRVSSYYLPLIENFLRSNSNF